MTNMQAAFGAVALVVLVLLVTLASLFKGKDPSDWTL